MAVPLGGIIPITLQLSRGETNKFPLAHVFDSAGAELAGSPVALTHLANGLYRSVALTMPATAFVMAQYLVYTDAGHTIVDLTYQYSEEEFEFLPAGNILPEGGNLVEIVGYVVQSVGPVNNNPIPDQQVLNVVQGEDFTIQVRLKNLSNFQPYYVSNLIGNGMTAQFLKSDNTVLNIVGTVHTEDTSLVEFILSNAQTTLLMLGNTQNFQVSFTQIINAQNVKSIVPMSGALNVTAKI